MAVIEDGSNDTKNPCIGEVMCDDVDAVKKR